MVKKDFWIYLIIGIFFLFGIGVMSLIVAFYVSYMDFRVDKNYRIDPPIIANPTLTPRQTLRPTPVPTPYPTRVPTPSPTPTVFIVPSITPEDYLSTYGYKNIALNKPVIAEQGQVYYQDHAQKRSSATITDGSMQTSWSIQMDLSGKPATAVIDLGNTYRISKIAYKIYWDTRAEYDNEIGVRADYSNKDTVEMLSVDEWDDWALFDYMSVKREEINGVQELLSSPVSARYIRIQVVDDDGWWAGWGSIAEVMVFEE